MKIKKGFALVGVLVMLMAVFSGCRTASTSSSEKIILKYVMAGPGMQEDSEKVWEVFNKKLQEKLPNVEVQFEIIPLAEYKQKFMLMNSSREQIDIVNNYGLDFGAEITNGTFAEMNKLLDQYGADVKKALPQWSFDYMTMKGKIYGIPTYQMYGTYRGINFFKEQADKYLNMEAFKKALYSSHTFNQEVYDILDKYVSDMKADGLKFKTVFLPNDKGYEMLSGNYAVTIGDEVCKVANSSFDQASYLKYKMARNWYEKGFIREDVLSATDSNNYVGKIDGVPFWDTVWNPFEQENLTAKYGKEIITVPYEDQLYVGYKSSAMGTSIMDASKHKDEAMQVLNLLQSNKDLFNLLVYGIEGEHYTKLGPDRIKTVAERGQATANDKYGLYKWIVGNTQLAYDNQLEPENYKKWVFEEANATQWRSPILGFIPDVSTISDNITQVSAIRDEYYNVLTSGTLESWQAYYEEWVQKVNLAGNDKIINELQNQVNVFLPSKK